MKISHVFRIVSAAALVMVLLECDSTEVYGQTLAAALGSYLVQMRRKSLGRDFVNILKFMTSR
ncbi:MAG: hypothetical protein EBS64_07085 [Verrucomicrobia bacterium]|nr:hypothetical protein [Verrucomicrobiota bacterium]